jgi:hypothetical protein
VDLSEPPLESNNNHRVEAKAVKTLLDSEFKTVKERGTNTNLVKKVSSKR